MTWHYVVIDDTASAQRWAQAIPPRTLRLMARNIAALFGHRRRRHGRAMHRAIRRHRARIAKGAP